ncbi:hypothetical protein OnM2_044046 [Erysiphe neolycopersici]|uniref:HAT C-terminal dimerisation domain-containing protein n=1 Tax=Erysiphe neolycopersici TaxID=212602 RepID=A0A420HV57_9PEZI|nr:hypothetical protein OnM2_044046 [Erysiphe neolycopersici]
MVQKLHNLTITTEEWYHVRLITSILKPFVTLTDLLFGTQEPLIHRSLVFLNTIADGLKAKLKMHLRNRYVSGRLKNDFVTAINAGIQKIEIFNHETEGASKLLYNLATILDPARKLLLFHEWDNKGNQTNKKYQQIYRKGFIDYFTENYQHTTSSPPEIALLRPSFQVRRSLEIQATRYLDSEVVDDEGGKLDPLDWRRRNEKEFPELAKMARDVLCVAISDIGMKRIFNPGRDIQNYIEAQFDGDSIRKALVLVYALRKTKTLLEKRHRKPHLPDDPDDLFDDEDIRDSMAIEPNQDDDDDDDFYNNNFYDADDDVNNEVDEQISDIRLT